MKVKFHIYGSLGFCRPCRDENKRAWQIAFLCNTRGFLAHLLAGFLHECAQEKIHQVAKRRILLSVSRNLARRLSSRPMDAPFWIRQSLGHGRPKKMFSLKQQTRKFCDVSWIPKRLFSAYVSIFIELMLNYEHMTIDFKRYGFLTRPRKYVSTPMVLFGQPVLTL